MNGPFMRVCVFCNASIDCELVFSNLSCAHYLYLCYFHYHDHRRHHPCRMPTIFHAKEMLHRLRQDREVVLYADLHGHSRCSNMFIYGCDDPRGDNPKRLLTRVFPYMLGKATPSFSFKDCNFVIQKNGSKDGTARVVSHRHIGIDNAYTLEASFAGPTRGPYAQTHFTMLDFQAMGRSFCETFIDYVDPTQTVAGAALRDLHALFPPEKKYADDDDDLGSDFGGDEAEEEAEESAMCVPVCIYVCLLSVSLPFASLFSLALVWILLLHSRIHALPRHHVHDRTDRLPAAVALYPDAQVGQRGRCAGSGGASAPSPHAATHVGAGLGCASGGAAGQGQHCSHFFLSVPCLIYSHHHHACTPTISHFHGRLVRRLVLEFFCPCTLYATLPFTMRPLLTSFNLFVHRFEFVLCRRL
jgi:hypothetical protein